MHPEMMGPYGPPVASAGYGSDHLSDDELENRRQELASIEPALRQLLVAFIDRSQSIPRGQLVTRDSGIKKVRRPGRAWAYERIVPPFAEGWFVPTPAAPTVVTHKDTSAAQTELKQAPGIAVVSVDELWKCVPSNAQLEVYEPLSITFGLVPHITGKAWNRASLQVDPEDLVSKFSSLLDSALAKPWGPQEPMTKRREREIDREYRRRRMAEAAAYRERMYGKVSFSTRLKRWMGLD